MNSKRRLELQNQHTFQQLQQQQQQQQDCDDMIIDEPPFKKHRPGVAANFLYKVVEFAAYTSAFATDAINTITGQSTTGRIYHDEDVLDDEDEDDVSHDQKIDKKDESAWEENVEEEEPPPPYDSTWSMPSPSSYTTNNTNNKAGLFTTPAISSSSSSQVEFSAPQQPLTSQQIVTKPQSHTNSRRRQFRVRRGRRLLRRKSSSADMTNNFNAHSYTQPENNDEEDIFLKFNCKLADMIAEGKAALNSKVDVTDVEMMIAEEKERDERIMREFGIQTPINRRARRFTSSSISSDYEYYSSILN